jgi:hypothetical protein
MSLRWPADDTVPIGQMLILAPHTLWVAVGWLLSRRAVVGGARAAVRSPAARGRLHTPLLALLERRIADGHPTDSFASLVEVLKRPA